MSFAMGRESEVGKLCVWAGSREGGRGSTWLKGKESSRATGEVEIGGLCRDKW